MNSDYIIIYIFFGAIATVIIYKLFKKSPIILNGKKVIGEDDEDVTGDSNKKKVIAKVVGKFDLLWSSISSNAKLLMPIALYIGCVMAVKLTLPEKWNAWWGDQKLFWLSHGLVAVVVVSALVPNWWTKWGLRTGFVVILLLHLVNIESNIHIPIISGLKGQAQIQQKDEDWTIVEAKEGVWTRVHKPEKYKGVDIMWYIDRDSLESQHPGNKQKLIYMTPDGDGSKDNIQPDGLLNGKMVHATFSVNADQCMDFYPEKGQGSVFVKVTFKRR